MATEHYTVVIVGAGPAGIGAAAHAAAIGMDHVLLERSGHIAQTIFSYQKGKRVDALPEDLPLRSEVPFKQGTREAILDGWQKCVEGQWPQEGATSKPVNYRLDSDVTGISGDKGNFTIELKNQPSITADNVVLAIGKGNARELTVPGAELDFVQYQLDDPDEYEDENVVVIGVGDAGLENALALAKLNDVVVINKGDGFERANGRNRGDILQAIADGSIEYEYNSDAARVEVRATADGRERGLLVLNGAGGEVRWECDRIIARIGAVPARRFVEACGIEFTSPSMEALPTLTPSYESAPGSGLFVIGALGGYELIRKAINQGYDVIETIAGTDSKPIIVEKAQDKLLKIPGVDSLQAGIAFIRKTLPLFDDLNDLQIQELIYNNDIKRPAVGEVIFEQNDHTDDFYCLLAGELTLHIEKGGKSLALPRTPGESFGEMSLISGRRRTASAIAGQGCVLLKIRRNYAIKLMKTTQSFSRRIDLDFLLRSMQTHIASSLTAEDLERLAPDSVHFDAGSPLFTEADPGDSLYFIRSGSVVVSKLVNGRDAVLSYIPAGHYVGELALLSDAPRSATVRAAMSTDAVRLDGVAFRSLMEASPELREQVEAVASQRSESEVDRIAYSAGGDNVASLLQNEGLAEATDVLLIDESLCVRCDNCEKACAETHGGASRLDREAGPTYATLHVPTSCRHCDHPHCMKECPPDVISRNGDGEVFIDTDGCIGCGNCQRNCPYGVIRMAPIAERKGGLLSWLLFGAGDAPGTRRVDADTPKKAMKCDLCMNLPGGPACVRACPTGAAIRVKKDQFFEIVRTAN